MAVLPVFSTSKGTGANGGTSDAADSTGANFIAVGIHRYSIGAITVSDSKSNTYTALTARQSSNQPGITWYYCLAPTVGSGHTFTVSVAGGYAAITVLGFSGVKTSSPFNTENGVTAGAAGASRQPGSVTPSADGSLIIAGVTLNGAYTSPSVNSSMTLEETVPYLAANYMGALAAYYIQPTAAAINPTFSWTNNVVNAAAIEVFLAEPDGGGGTSGPLIGGRLTRSNLTQGKLIAP